MTATLYVNNVWFKTINVDKFHERIKYIIPDKAHLRPLNYIPDVNEDNYMLIFLHTGHGFYHVQVKQTEFELIFKDRYERRNEK